MKESDLGIFIQRIPFSETSAIVSYFTQNHGFQKFLFLGAKKKANLLFPLNVQELSYFFRNESELGKLTQVESTLEVKDIPFDPFKSSIAFFVAEVLQKCLNHTEKDTQLFEFLRNKIQQLELQDNLAMYPIQFLLELTFFLGIEPQVEEEIDVHFNLEEGVFARNVQKDKYCSEECSEVILTLVLGKEVALNHQLRKETLEVLLVYYKLHLEHFGNLKSIEVLETILQP